MNFIKHCAAIAVFGALSASAAFAQTTTTACLDPTMFPPGYVPPPGVCMCSTTTTTTTTTAPATTTAAPAPAPAPAVTTVSGVTNNGLGYEHESDEGRADQHLMFTGTISGDTLTVTSIAAGKFRIGTKLSGTGIPRGTEIKAYGTGHGGVGTYKIGKDAH